MIVYIRCYLCWTKESGSHLYKDVSDFQGYNNIHYYRRVNKFAVWFYSRDIEKLKIGCPTYLR